MILTLVDVEKEDELPEVYWKLAQANKKEECALTQHLLHVQVAHLNSYGDQPCIMTPSLAKMIIEFDFVLRRIRMISARGFNLLSLIMGMPSSVV